MAKSWFVKPDLVRLPLSEGNFLDVKRQLTAGEERHIFAGVVKTMTPGQKMELDPEQVGRTKLLEYIVDWGGPNLVDDDGRPVPFSGAALDNLPPERYAEIVKVVDDHEAAETMKREAEKNDPAGMSEPIKISPFAS